LREKIIGKFDLRALTDSYIFIPVNDVFILMAEKYGIGLEELKRIAEKLSLAGNLIAYKEDYYDGYIITEGGAKFPFDAKTFEIDGLEVFDTYDENYNTYVVLGGFPLTLAQDEQIQAEVREIDLSTQKFGTLRRDAVEMLLRNTSPQDVASLCQTNQQFRRVCNNPSLFRRLMDKHYPNAIYTNDPRRQFYALVEGVRTYYRLPVIDQVLLIERETVVKKYVFGPPEEMAEEDDLYNTIPGGEYHVFTVDGVPVPPGTTLYLLMDFDLSSFSSKVFKTREMLADNYAENFEIFEDMLLRNFDEEEEDIPREQVVKSKRFRDFLMRHEVRLPFTRENLRKQALEDESLYLSPETLAGQYQVIIVHF